MAKNLLKLGLAADILSCLNTNPYVTQKYTGYTAYLVNPSVYRSSTILKGKNCYITRERCIPRGVEGQIHYEVLQMIAYCSFLSLISSVLHFCYRLAHFSKNICIWYNRFPLPQMQCIENILNELSKRCHILRQLFFSWFFGASNINVSLSHLLVYRIIFLKAGLRFDWF